MCFVWGKFEGRFIPVRLLCPCAKSLSIVHRGTRGLGPLCLLDVAPRGLPACLTD